MDEMKEIEGISRSLSDKSRKIKRVGRSAYVPHKFDDAGELLDQSSFDSRKHISKLNLHDLRFLRLWADNKWDDAVVASKSDLSPEQLERTFKKLQYFKVEDARIMALAKEATQERILAKDMENIEVETLTDSQHKSLDRVAKIIGAFKSTATVNIQQNVFNMPKLSVETMQKLKEFADLQANVVDGEIAA